MISTSAVFSRYSSAISDFYFRKIVSRLRMDRFSGSVPRLIIPFRSGETPSKDQTPTHNLAPDAKSASCPLDQSCPQISEPSPDAPSNTTTSGSVDEDVTGFANLYLENNSDPLPTESETNTSPVCSDNINCRHPAEFSYCW